MTDYKLFPFCFLLIFIFYPVYKYKENKRNERIAVFAKAERKKMPAGLASKAEKTEDLIFSNYYLRKKEQEENLYVIHFSDNKGDSVLVHDVGKNVCDVIGIDNVEKMFSK